MDVIFIYLCTFVVGYFIFKKLKEWQNLPPGPWGLPVLGYLPFLDRRFPHLTLTDLSKRYGPIYGISMGSVYTVVLSDHKLIRDAFAKDNFSGRAPLYLTHGIMHGNGIICAEGGLWKDQRKLITTWLKSFGMSKHGVSRDKLEGRISTGVYELLEDIDRKGGTPMDLSHMLTNSLGNVVNELIFGYKFPPEDKTWSWLRQIQEEGCNEMGVAGLVNFLPLFRFISASTRKTIEVLVRGQAQTHRLYASIIHKRRRTIGLQMPEGAEYRPHCGLFNEHPKGYIKCVKYSKYTTTEEHFFDPEILIPTDGECILDNFLAEQKKRFNSGEENACYTTDEQLLYLLADMFGAGLDTTSVTLGWFLLYMALYPEEQEIVRQEILTVYPEEGQIDGADLPHLMAAICETQRIRSIVPVGIPHGCLEVRPTAVNNSFRRDTFFGNYKIPKGTMVVPLQWALHMDSNIWDDPQEFRPSRFLAPDGSLVKPPEFIPFQVGKRMCPGDELSRMLSCGLVVRLFRRKRIRLASNPPTEEEMMGTVGVTLSAPHVKFFCDSL